MSSMFIANSHFYLDAIVYMIYVYNGTILKHKINTLLGMSEKDYQSLAEKFGAVLFASDVVFKDEKDATKFADYLNNKYLLVLTLAGKI